MEKEQNSFTKSGEQIKKGDFFQKKKKKNK